MIEARRVFDINQISGESIVNQSADRQVLLIGATGMLGGAILEALLNRETLHVRALLRPGKPGVAESLKARGVEVAEGDVMDPKSLPSAMEGIDVAVVALHNDPNLFVPGHKNLIDAAEAAGVERLIPSDFSVDLFKIDEEENFNLAMRKQVVPCFEGRRVRPIHVLIGAFMDTMLDKRFPLVDWERRTLPFFGDGKQPCDFTSVEYAGRYVAAVCADRQAPEVVRFAGDMLTMPELAGAMTRAFDQAITPEPQGTVDQLAALIETKKETAENPLEWIALQYHHNMVSGRAKLDPLDNQRYPEVSPLPFEAFARKTGEGNAHGIGNTSM